MPERNKRIYNNIDRVKVNAILQALTEHGSRISGNNPWSVDTGHHGVMLLGEWDEASLTLTITVTDADWYVPRKAVWEEIETLMRRVKGPQKA